MSSNLLVLSPDERATPAANGEQAKSSPLVSLNNLTYNAIRQRILSNRLRPGAKLVHEQLAKELKVSRTPVREALERLYSEGFIVHYRHRGFFVAEIDESEALELYGMREALELFAVRSFFEKGVFEGLDELSELNHHYREMIEGGSMRERMIADRDFHLHLARLTGNGRLVGSLEAVFDRVILKRRIEGFLPTRGIKAYEDHVKFLDVCRTHDGVKAELILRQHIRGACHRLQEHLRMLAEDND